jgi:hypothetical protein
MTGRLIAPYRRRCVSSPILEPLTQGKEVLIMSKAKALKTHNAIEKARVVFTRAVIAALESGTPLPPEVQIEEVVGGFTVKNAAGFFVVTVQKAG